MERNYDQVMADLLIQLDGIERRMERADHRMMRADKLKIRLKLWKFFNRSRVEKLNWRKKRPNSSKQKKTITGCAASS